MPRASWRMPSSGSSAISTSAIRLLVVGSQPGELDAGCLADQAASSVAPDEIVRPQRLAVGQLDVDAGVVLRETRHLTSAIDRHRQLADPAGQDALDVVLPQPEPVGVPGGEVADVQADPGELPRPGPPVPPRGTDRRFRADRGPRWCVSADRLRASRRGPGSRAARRWRRRRPPAPTRPPTSAPSDLLRRSPPHVSVIALLRSVVPALRPAIIRHGPGLHEGLRSAINQVRQGTGALPSGGRQRRTDNSPKQRRDSVAPWPQTVIGDEFRTHRVS